MEKKKKKKRYTDQHCGKSSPDIFVLSDENFNLKTYHILESHKFMKKWV